MVHLEKQCERGREKREAGRKLKDRRNVRKGKPLDGQVRLKYINHVTIWRCFEICADLSPLVFVYSY